MNIAVVSYGFPTDEYPTNGNFQYDQAKSLKSQGNNVVFIAIDLRSFRRKRKFGISIFQKDDIEIININIPIGPCFFVIHSIASRIAFRYVFKHYLKNRNIDIFHFHFGITAIPLFKYCIRIRVPYVVTEHASGINLIKKNTIRYRRFLQLYSNAAGIITVSKSLHDILLDRFCIESTIIHNIVDVDSFNLKNQELKKDCFRFVSSGHLLKDKGFDILIRAFKLLHNKHNEVKLVIMGDGNYKLKLIDLVNELELGKSVCFYGQYLRAEFNNILNESDVFVLASLHETFGLVYIEAMATGTPVIATKCGGPSEFVNDYNGRLVDINDVDGLFENMDFFYENSSMFNSLKIRQFAMNYSSNIIGRTINNFLKERIKKV